ncbi:MAG: flagellar brake protein [Lachnospiraceae bacterium]|nr:flagellar brake protein [Lachnospiraceae bacterium]
MLSKYVKVGDKLDLETIESLGESETLNEKRQYRSSVFDIIAEDQLKVAMPMEHGKLVLLPIDGEYNLCFYTSNGLYQCLARVIDRYRNDNVFVLVLELTTDLSKYQRREYYRLNCVLDMKSRAVKEAGDKGNVTEKVEFLDTDITFNNGIMVDISGGGARFISKVRYPIDTEILFVFKLFVSGKLNEYRLRGKVLFSEPMTNNPNAYEHRIQFINILNDERESIIRYIFEEERKIRRREKG